MAGNPHESNATSPLGSGDDRPVRRRIGTVSRVSTRRSIRAIPPAYRWECPCQDPPVLLATYDPNGRMNIKVRDRYWHLYGFGQVQAICPRCAGEHVLDLRFLQAAIENQEQGDEGMDDRVTGTGPSR